MKEYIKFDHQRNIEINRYKNNIDSAGIVKAFWKLLDFLAVRPQPNLPLQEGFVHQVFSEKRSDPDAATGAPCS